MAPKIGVNYRKYRSIWTCRSRMAAEGEEEEDDGVAKLYPAFAWTRNTGVLVGGVLAEE